MTRAMRRWRLEWERRIMDEDEGSFRARRARRRDGFCAFGSAFQTNGMAARGLRAVVYMRHMREALRG